MVREVQRSERGDRGWNRLFPTHANDSRHHDVEENGHVTDESTQRLLAAAEARNLMLLARVALLGVAAYAFNIGFKIHIGPGAFWVVSQLLLYLAALGCLILAFVARDGSSLRIQNVVAMILGMAIVLAVAFEITVLNPNYGTDVIAFAHGGGEILLDGRNPYQASPQVVDEISTRFGVGATRTTDGGVIDWLISYPALHLLTYTTFLAVDVTDLRWGTLAVELIALAVIWCALSPKGRLLAPLVLLIEPFLGVVFTGGGVTDWLWVLPVAVTAISLNRRNFGYAGIALGLACAVKQHPWFAVPFVLIWVIQILRSEHDGRLPTEARRSVAGFLAGLGAGFVVPNLPFILWDPPSWFRGVLSPALGDMVADGHGLALLVSRELIDLRSEVFLALVVAGLVGSMFIYARHFDRLQDLLWVLPPVLMFLSYRSLHSYFVFWIPVALLWLDLRFAGPTARPSVTTTKG